MTEETEWHTMGRKFFEGVVTETMKYKIIDIHNHIFPDKIAERAVLNIGKYYHLEMLGKGTVDSLFDSGKKIGVDYYVVHSSATHVEQVKSVNNFVVDSVKKHQNLIGFGTLHPQLKEPEDEISRITKAGLKGIKLHPEFQKFKIDDETMMPVYKAIEGKLPLEIKISLVVEHIFVSFYIPVRTGCRYFIV